jgi:hypothetical protein
VTRTESELADIIAAVAEVVVDTDTFVTTIKRRARRRHQRHLAVAGVGTVAVATAVAVPVTLGLGPRASGPPGSEASPPQALSGICTAELIADPLNVEPGSQVQLFAMDPSGRYVVGSYGSPVDAPSNRMGVAVRWDNGVGTVLPVEGDNDQVFAGDVNRKGSVVGTLRRNIDGEYVSIAWAYTEALGWRVLYAPQNYNDSVAIGIDDNDDVLGYASTGARIDTVAWSIDAYGNWTTRVIGPSGTTGLTLEATDDGTLVGVLTAGEPYVWYPDGTGRLLELPDGITWGSVSDASGDWAVGFAPGVVATGTPRPVRWNIRTGEVSLVDDEPAASRSVAVSARGDVAWAAARSTPAAILRTTDGREYELPVPERSDGVVRQAGVEPVAVSEDATVIIGAGGELWRC